MGALCIVPARRFTRRATKEAEVTRSAPSSALITGNIRHGFVYERVPHVTLKSTNNAEIDVIWEKYKATLELFRATLNKALKKNWEEWEIPRDADTKWPDATDAHTEWWKTRIAHQREIASIAARLMEYLYDRPYEDKKKVRVAGHSPWNRCRHIACWRPMSRYAHRRHQGARPATPLAVISIHDSRQPALGRCATDC